MADINKISPDDGSTILNIKDSNAVHWSDNAILGAKNIYNPAAYQGAYKATYALSNNNSTVVVTSSESAQYTNARWTLNLKENTNYKVRANVTITSGAGAFKIQTPSETSIKQSPTMTSSGTYEMEFNSGANTVLQLVLFATVGTAASGNVTYDQLVISLASDTDNTYQPYAMTNRELTELSTPISGSITYETGISQYVGTDIPLNKVSRMGVIAIDVTGVVGNVSTWIKIGTVPIGYRPHQSVSLMAGAYARKDKFDCAIYTNGDLKIRDNSAAIVADEIIYINGIYILA